MSRKNPEKNPPEVRENPKPGWVTETRKYKVITPLFGGGEEPQKPDSLTVVRATEVRGHLRFWWRATRGGAFDGDLKKMKEAEEKIWGSSAEKGKPGPSQVIVNILEWKQGKLKGKIEITSKGKKELVEIGEPKSPWGYVAFPLRVEKDENGNIKKPAGSVLPDVEFQLELKYPQSLQDDVEAALWGWETFGGIGARTRRGFGALQCDSSPKPATQSARDQILNGLKKYVLEEAFPKGVPHLTKQLEFRTIPKSDETLAWEYLFKKLKDFRQHREPPKNSRPGPSHWPEPDSIRRILSDKKLFTVGVHKPTHAVMKKFPRAKFGLPISFEFPKKEDKDPKKTILQGKPLGNDKYIDRLASPLIIRPLICSDGAVGLTAILEWEPIGSDELYTPPGGLFLTSKGYGDFQVESNLDTNDAKNIEPLKDVKGKPQPNILIAFLDSLE